MEAIDNKENDSVMTDKAPRSVLITRSLILCMVDNALNQNKEISVAEFISLFGSFSEEIKEGINEILNDNKISVIEEKPEEAAAISSLESDDSFYQPPRDEELFNLTNLKLWEKAHAGDQNAKNALLIKNKNTIYKIALQMNKIYAPGNFGVDDLFQSGSFGLLEAIKKFDPSVNDNFMVYASFCIRQMMVKDAMNYGENIGLPVHLAEKLNKLTEYYNMYSDSTEEDICLYMISNQVIKTPAEYKRLCDIMRKYTNAQLDEIVSYSEEPADVTLEFNGINSPSPVFFANDPKLREQIEKVLTTMTEKEQQIIRMRFGFDDGEQRTLEYVGNQLGVSRGHIRQIEAKALRRLRHPGGSKGLRDYLD